jgi:hypothetical protein
VMTHFGSWHFHLEVGVVRDRHEHGVARPPKDGVVALRLG